MTDTDIEQLHPSLGKKNDDAPQVYVACLGCYNEGRLHGSWVDADDLQERWDYAEEHDRQDRVGHFNKCSRPFHDEWAIHDYDGVSNLGEHPDIPKLITVMRLFEEHGEGFREWYNYCPSHANWDNPEEVWQDRYQGEYDSEKAFAEEWADTCGYLSLLEGKVGEYNPLLHYIDWDWYWNADLRYGFTFSNGHVWSDN